MPTSYSFPKDAGYCFLTAVVGALLQAILFAEPALEKHPSKATTELPNIIVVLVDNAGYGDIGPFGSRRNRTPNLDRMAREGMRFTHFCASAGVCTPSRASLMTGCYAQRVGLGLADPDGIVLRPVSPNGLHPDELTIAEVLKSRGYATGIIGKWHLGDQLPFLPTRQGFDMFFGIPYSDDMTADVGPPGKWPPLPLMENERVIEAPVDRTQLTERYTRRALRFIEANRSRPFFLYFPEATPGSTRTPYVGDAFRGKSGRGPWSDSIEELDWSLGQILDKLCELGIEKRTLVAWMSDNGAPNRGSPSNPWRGTNRPLYGYGYTTAEGAFRVPAIFWWPGTIPAGRTCDELATMMDLLPTCARLAVPEKGTGPIYRNGPKGTVYKLALSPFPARTIDGRDIRPLLLGEKAARSPHNAFYYYFGDQLQAVRSGRWKLFLPLEHPQRHPHHRGKGPSPAMLFDLVADVGSQHNVAENHPQIVARLTKLANNARADLGDSGRPGKGQRSVGRVENPTPRVLMK
ncbi:MAG: sulfatase [Pirellulales bacterium]|nr:sulfatase [Pirellulales bacterium]